MWELSAALGLSACTLMGLAGQHTVQTISGWLSSQGCLCGGRMRG